MLRKRRLWLSLLLCGFAWPGEAERLVGELTTAATPREKRDLLRLLGQLEQFPLEPVRPLARDPDPSVRVDALRVLAPRDPSVLEAAARDPAPEVRRAALSFTPDLQSLLAGLDDNEPQVNLVALQRLARSPDASVLRALINELTDDALDVRIEAARVLGERSEPEAREALLAEIDAPLPELRAAAVDALWSEPRVVRRALQDRDPGVLLAALRGYARNPQLPRAELKALADSPSFPQVASAARALLAASSASEPAWLSALQRTTEGADPALVIEQLERDAPDVLATDPLLEWLPRAPFWLAPRIVALIERAGGEVHPAQLQAWLAADPPRRALALRLLARSSSNRELIHALHHDDAASVRAVAAEVLASRDVRELAGSYPDVPLRALASTRLIPSRRTLAALSRDVREGDAERASQALRALGPIANDEARALILRALDEPPLVLAALRASVYDHSLAARDKRRALLSATLGQVAASALTASVLAEDPIESDVRGAWPVAEVNAFAIAHTKLRGQPGVQTYAAGSFDPALRHDGPRALRTTHDLMLISFPDATGRIDWPSLRVVEAVMAWPQSHERK